jgi:hypothetical protein
VATLDRIEPAYTPWSPVAAGLGVIDTYVGRHRRRGERRRSPLALFYVGRHRVR